MADVQILLEIQRSLGKLESSQAAHSTKLNEIHEQVKYTNGRVNSLRSDVDELIGGNGKKKASVTVPLTKEQIAIIGGAILAVSTYVLDKLI